MGVVNTPITKLFLSYNAYREEWQITNNIGKVYGIGDCPEHAIKSARTITNAPIYADQQFRGIIDGPQVIPEINADEIPEDTTLYGGEEIIEAMAELSGFEVKKVVEKGFFIGYTMELVE